jgi:SmpA / OmlA family
MDGDQSTVKNQPAHGCGLAGELISALGQPAKRLAPKLVSKTAIALLIATIIGLTSGCSDKRITKANVNEVTEGMSKKQVESILGPPTSIDTKDFVVTKTTTYTYRQGKDSVTIVFRDDKLQSKDSTLSE